MPTPLRSQSRNQGTLAFERAVQLDPENIQAMSDLASSTSKHPHSSAAVSMPEPRHSQRAVHPPLPRPVSPSPRSHRRKEKDNAAAEAEFAVPSPPGKTPEAYIDLGHFLSTPQSARQDVRSSQSAIAPIDARTLLSSMPPASLRTPTDLPNSQRPFSAPISPPPPKLTGRSCLQGARPAGRTPRIAAIPPERIVNMPLPSPSHRTMFLPAKPCRAHRGKAIP
jgi:hypothetical protein